jgi:signal transduction histidine kinase
VTRRELVRLVVLACRGIERIVADTAVASINLDATDPVVLVGEVVAAARLRGVRVELSTPAIAPAVDIDPPRLGQALDNLITNAVVHGGPHGSVSVSVEVEETLSIAVSDTGPGISADQLERIFDLGVRLEPESPGTGLGLALARAIVEGHGGTLTAASVPDRGTTFTITLPLLER